VAHVCPWWFAYTFDNPVRRLLHPPERVLGRWVRPGMTVLDVGCGIGHFTIGMARLVGPGGRVIAADLQERALSVVRRRAERAGLADRVTTHHCTPRRIGVPGPLDFALAFWMAHETPSQLDFLGELAAALRPGGNLLVVEPRFHVTDRQFEETLEAATLAGFAVGAAPSIRASRSVLLERPPGLRIPRQGQPTPGGRSV
jgi:ubiquinone/menaquinone biosynthesis C-methylase UbiE